MKIETTDDRMVIHGDGVIILGRRTRGLAAQADALAAEIDALHQDIRTADEVVHRAAFRCATAIGSVRHAARELGDTAADLDRIAAAAVAGTCSVPWGACPEHGNTLVSSGGRTWCRDASCSRTWDYDRGSLPCTEPARWTVTDQDGGTAMMCDGHTLAARVSLDGARAVPLVACRKRQA